LTAGDGDRYGRSRGLSARRDGVGERDGCLSSSISIGWWSCATGDGGEFDADEPELDVLLSDPESAAPSVWCRSAALDGDGASLFCGDAVVVGAALPAWEPK
jgi:hypothetical protein